MGEVRLALPTLPSLLRKLAKKIAGFRAVALGEGVADKTGTRRTFVRRVRTWERGGIVPLPQFIP